MTPRSQVPDELLQIEAYYDAVPRAAARVEEWGPLRLFVQQGAGWPYYARPASPSSSPATPDPTRGASPTPFHPEDVARVRARQRELGIPEEFEWVHELAPTLRGAAEHAGLSVHTHPLMLLTSPVTSPPPPGVTVRRVDPELPDAALARIGAVAAVGFATPGTQKGETGTEALGTEARATATTPERLAFQRERLRAGRNVSAVAELDGQPVSAGSHQPVGEVSEIVGVATLPAYRRRGIGAALVSFLVDDALRHGVRTIFLTAGDADVARMYARLGFTQIATACIAQPPT